MVAHNADFDMSFIKKNCQRQGIDCHKTVLDTVALARGAAAAAEPFQAGHGGQGAEY